MGNKNGTNWSTNLGREHSMTFLSDNIEWWAWAPPAVNSPVQVWGAVSQRTCSYIQREPCRMWLIAHYVADNSNYSENLYKSVLQVHDVDTNITARIHTVMDSSTITWGGSPWAILQAGRLCEIPTSNSLREILQVFTSGEFWCHAMKLAVGRKVVECFNIISLPEFTLQDRSSWNNGRNYTIHVYVYHMHS